MKVVRNIDNLGRIVLPMDFRNTLGLESGSAVNISIEGGAIVLRPLETMCKVCGSHKNVNKDLLVCASCIKKIKKLN